MTRDASADNPQPRLPYLVGRVDRIVRRELEAALSDADLNIAQYTAMSVLAARPGLSNAQLARRSLVTPQAMHQAMSGMTERGLIERKPHPTQGRVLCVELSEAGFELLEQMNARVDDVEERLMADLDESQRAGFIEILSRLAEIGPN
jgi:DNA-binding MarR family transcriptional regulator